MRTISELITDQETIANMSDDELKAHVDTLFVRTAVAFDRMPRQYRQDIVSMLEDLADIFGPDEKYATAAGILRSYAEAQDAGLIT